jgi:DNA-binding cell septation regulator SpoVG
MKITSVNIETNQDASGRLKASAEVVLNGILCVKGIKVMQGRYGLFLAFPRFSPDSPYRAFETLSMKLRKELHARVLEAYGAITAKTATVFG